MERGRFCNIQMPISTCRRGAMADVQSDRRSSSFFYFFTGMADGKDSIICAAHSIRSYRKSSFAQYLVKFAPFSTSEARAQAPLLAEPAGDAMSISSN